MTNDEGHYAKQTGGSWRIKKSQRPDLPNGGYLELEFTAAGLGVFSAGGRVNIMFAYNSVRWENWGGKLAMLEVDGTPLELEASSNTSPATVLTTLLRWRDGFVEDEATAAIAVWSYPGRTQADAGIAFATHAQTLAAKGYRPIAQSWAEGRPGLGRILTLGTDMAGMIKPKGFLTVTYQLADAAPTNSRQPDLIDQIRRLGELRDAGILTPQEFEAKKAELLARI